MSFTSLKKSTLSDKPRLVTVDQFIDDAMCYAHGLKGLKDTKNLLHVVDIKQHKVEKTKRCTFTLDKASTDILSELTSRTGICKSRILRILTQQHLDADNDYLLLESQIA